MSESKPYHLYVERISDYTEQVKNGLAWINFGKLVTPDTKIFIKPNLTFPNYRQGVMTNPAAIESAIIAIKDYTNHILIGDADSGGYNRFAMDEVYRETGIAELADRYGVQIVNLSKGPRKPVHFSYQGRQFSVDLPCLLTEECDLLLTMPVPKIHGNTGVSLTFKNQWGCIPEPTDRLRLHPYFKHVILEVNRAVKTRVAIIDGTYGLNQNGPLRGKPVRLDWTIVTDSIGAGARVALELMQIPLEKIEHLRYAQRNGWIPALDEVRINQDYQHLIKEKFVLQRELTDYPGLLAFRNPFLAWLAYFSPLAGWLHDLLYLVREPFYDYKKHTKRTSR